jgi:glycerol-3-phosphate cytidylyltransferase-like family protein
VVARDANVERIKGTRPHLLEDARRQLVERSGLADRVMLGSAGNPLEIFASQEIDVVVLGYDQQVTEDDVTAAAERFSQHPKILRAKPYLPFLYKNRILRLLGPFSSWFRRL